MGGTTFDATSYYYAFIFDSSTMLVLPASWFRSFATFRLLVLIRTTTFSAFWGCCCFCLGYDGELVAESPPDDFDPACFGSCRFLLNRSLGLFTICSTVGAGYLTILLLAAATSLLLTLKMFLKLPESAPVRLCCCWSTTDFGDSRTCNHLLTSTEDYFCLSSFMISCSLLLGWWLLDDDASEFLFGGSASLF